MRHELEKQGHEKCQSRKKLRLATVDSGRWHLDFIRRRYTFLGIRHDKNFK